MPSKTVYVAANGNFLWLSSIPLYECLYPLIWCLDTETVHILATVNNAAMNIGVRWTWVSHLSTMNLSFSSVQLLSRVQLFATPRSQHAKPPCPSPTPGVYTNLCPLSRWCYLTISSSAIPSPFAFNLSQHECLFQWISSSHQVAKVLEFQLQHQFFQWIFRTDFL